MQIQQPFFYILVYPPETALSTAFGITPPRICQPLELTHPLSVNLWNYPTPYLSAPGIIPPPYLSVSKIILLLICQASGMTPPLICEQKRDLATEKQTEGSKPIATVEPCSTHNTTTLDHLMMARELKKKLELRQST